MTKEKIKVEIDNCMYWAIKEEEILKLITSDDPYRKIAERNIEFYLGEAARLEILLNE